MPLLPHAARIPTLTRTTGQFASADLPQHARQARHFFQVHEPGRGAAPLRLCPVPPYRELRWTHSGGALQGQSHHGAHAVKFDGRGGC